MRIEDTALTTTNQTEDMHVLVPSSDDEPTVLGTLPLPPQTTSDERWLDTAHAISHTYKAAMTDVERHRPSYIAQPTTVACILGAVDSGLTPAQAGATLGFSHSTVQAWLDRAKDASHPAQQAYQAFAEACEAAWNYRRRRLLGRLEIASEKPQHWTAGAWLLERGYGDDYKLAPQKQGGNVVIQIGAKDSELAVNIGVTGGATSEGQ